MHDYYQAYKNGLSRCLKHSLSPDQFAYEEANMAVSTLPQESGALRVALYARISTLNHGQDVGLQLRELREYARARRWHVAGEYVDAGVSGSVESRPELNRLMDDARKRRVDVVACWRFDRFARSTKHLLLALEEFRSLGIQFLSYQENIDTTSPLGQAVFTIAAAVATLERDLIRERVRAGLRNARSKGKRLGRPCAIVDVAKIAALRSSGVSWRAIARKLGVGEGTVRRAFAKNPPATGFVSTYAY
jgi:DNA invertase Pin-like site-specific DNA recombinase